jgi:hypothetical protein
LLGRFELEDIISQATYEVGWRALLCFEKVHEIAGGGWREGYWRGWRGEGKMWSKREREITAVRNMSNDTVTVGFLTRMPASARFDKSAK